MGKGIKSFNSFAHLFYLLICDQTTSPIIGILNISPWLALNMSKIQLTKPTMPIAMDSGKSSIPKIQPRNGMPVSKAMAQRSISKNKNQSVDCRA